MKEPSKRSMMLTWLKWRAWKEYSGWSKSNAQINFIDIAQQVLTAKGIKLDNRKTKIDKDDGCIHLELAYKEEYDKLTSNSDPLNPRN